MDPLSDILSLLRPNSYGFRGLDAGGDWLLAFARDDGIKCYAIQSGSCWLAMEGEAKPKRKRREQFARFRLTLARSVRTAGVAAV
jgi:hypothetical protein